MGQITEKTLWHYAIMLLQIYIYREFVMNFLFIHVFYVRFLVCLDIVIYLHNQLHNEIIQTKPNIRMYKTYVFFCIK